MSIHKAVTLGLSGNEMSKAITGSSESSVGRSAVATGCGAALGAAASGTLVVAGLASAPVTVPLVAAAASISFIASCLIEKCTQTENTHSVPCLPFLTFETN